MRDQVLLERAKSMRRELTAPEQRLWVELRASRFERAKFRRQLVIGRYIVDFACRTPKKLVIEIDGDTHAEQGRYDAARTRYLEERGYRAMRFNNEDVMGNLEGVLLTIQRELLTPPLPTLSPEGERE